MAVVTVVFLVFLSNYLYSVCMSNFYTSVPPIPTKPPKHVVRLFDEDDVKWTRKPDNKWVNEDGIVVEWNDLALSSRLSEFPVHPAFICDVPPKTLLFMSADMASEEFNKEEIHGAAVRPYTTNKLELVESGLNISDEDVSRFNRLEKAHVVPDLVIQETVSSNPGSSLADFVRYFYEEDFEVPPSEFYDEAGNKFTPSNKPVWVTDKGYNVYVGDLSDYRKVFTKRPKTLWDELKPNTRYKVKIHSLDDPDDVHEGILASGSKSDFNALYGCWDIFYRRDWAIDSLEEDK